MKITEEKLKKIISESIKKTMNELFTDTGMWVGDNELSAMENAFTNYQTGQEILDKCEKEGAKIVKGKIVPEKQYSEAPYHWNTNNLFADAIIEYPNGKRHTLMKRKNY